MDEMQATGEGRPVFREEQRFRQRWLVGLLVAVPVVLLVAGGAALLLRLRDAKPWGGEDTIVTISLAGAMVFSIALVPWFLQIRLVTEIRAGGLAVRFHWLGVKRLIPYSDIVHCDARTYHPILEYGGWGVRWGGRRGKAYNVSGNRGVQLELSGGKRLLIGSQRVDELAGAIQSRMQSSQARAIQSRRPSSDAGPGAALTD